MSQALDSLFLTSRTVFGDCRNLVKALRVCGNNLRSIEAKHTDQRGNMYAGEDKESHVHVFIGIKSQIEIERN